MPTKSFDIRLPIRGDLFVPLRGYPLVRYIYHIILSANCKQNLIYISIQLLGKNQAMIRGFWGDKIGYIRYIKTRYRALIWGDIGRNRGGARDSFGISDKRHVGAFWGYPMGGENRASYIYIRGRYRAQKKIVKRCRSQDLFSNHGFRPEASFIFKIIEKSKSPGFSIKKRMEVYGYSKIVIRFGGNRQLGAWGLYRANLGFWAFWGYRVGNRKTSPRRQNQVG